MRTVAIIATQVIVTVNIIVTAEAEDIFRQDRPTCYLNLKIRRMEPGTTQLVPKTGVIMIW